MATDDSRPLLVASIFPLRSIVEQLAGPWANVQTLLPSGANPHDFEPSAAQMAPLSHATVLLTVGLALDTWADKTAKRVGTSSLEIIRMVDLVKPANSDATNQHLWMDPDLAIRYVEALVPILQKKFPAHAADMQARGESLARELRQMDDDFRKRLSDVTQRKMISYHNAYDLLARRYGLEVVAHLTEIELAPGGEVTPKDLVETVEAVKKFHLKVIYAEPQFPGKAVQLIHDQTGVRVLSLDDLGGPDRPGYDSYQAMMRSDVKTLVDGQK